MSDTPARRITPPALVREPPLGAVLAALPGTRLVGGAVRDLLAGRPVADIDIGTPWLPERVMAALAAAGIRTVPTGLDHGTVTAVSDHRGFEVTTLRRDVETDGRRAKVIYTDDWRADAARRDFTINAMSMSPDGAIYDYFGGIGDLEAGRVCFVGDPATRIAEDYLRILRFFRFHARYGSGEPDPQALTAIADAVPRLAHLSVERVWSELSRILAVPDPRGAIALMQQTGVLAAVLPEGADPDRLARLIEAGAPKEPVLRLAALLTGDPEALAQRLRLSNAERERLKALQSDPTPTPDADDNELRRLLADTPASVLIGRTWLTGGSAPGFAALRARLEAMPRPVFPLVGRDVLALGRRPGPEVGRLLRDVRAWWLANGCVADAAACQAELARRLGD
jgi:poly(A) polymerase